MSFRSGLSTAWTLIKENPWKFFLGSFSAVFLTVVGMWYSDISFVHKSDLEKFKSQTEQVIQSLQDKVNELSGLKQKQ
jgi:hypothetical protein